MTERITDPEILADLQLRNASERDRSRSGEPTFGIVEHWPCEGCSAMVPVGQLALDTLAVMNRELARRRQQPLPKRAQCDECKAKREELETARRSGRAQTEMPGVDPARSAR